MSAAVTALFGFSVHHKEICGLEVFSCVEGWKERSDNPKLSEIVHDEGTTTVKVSICFLDSFLQDYLVQNINFCCFLNDWWRETGMSPQSITLHWEPPSQEEQIFV